MPSDEVRRVDHTQTASSFPHFVGMVMMALPAAPRARGIDDDATEWAARAALSPVAVA